MGYGILSFPLSLSFSLRHTNNASLTQTAGSTSQCLLLLVSPLFGFGTDIHTIAGSPSSLLIDSEWQEGPNTSLGQRIFWSSKSKSAWLLHLHTKYTVHCDDDWSEKRQRNRFDSFCCCCFSLPALISSDCILFFAIIIIRFVLKFQWNSMTTTGVEGVLYWKKSVKGWATKKCFVRTRHNNNTLFFYLLWREKQLNQYNSLSLWMDLYDSCFNPSFFCCATKAQAYMCSRKLQRLLTTCSFLTFFSAGTVIRSETVGQQRRRNWSHKHPFNIRCQYVWEKRIFTSKLSLFPSFQTWYVLLLLLFEFLGSLTY